MSHVRENNFRVKIKAVTEVVTENNAAIPKKFVQFVNVKRTATIDQLVNEIKLGFALYDCCVELFLDDYLLQETDPIQVLKEDDCITASIHRNGQPRAQIRVTETNTPVREAGATSEASAVNGIAEEHEEVSLENAESHANKKRAKKKKKRHQENCEEENGSMEVCDIVSSGHDTSASQQTRKKKRAKDELEEGEDKLTSRRKRSKKRKHTESRPEESPVSGDEEPKDKKKKRKDKCREIVVSLPSPVKDQETPPQEEAETNQGETSCNWSARVESSQRTPQEEKVSHEPRNRSMWDVKETCDAKVQFAVPEIPATKDNFFDQRTSNASFDDSEQSFTEKKKRRRRKKKKPDVTPVDNKTDGRTTVFLRNPTLFAPPAQKAGRRKWADAPTKHIHFAVEDDEPFTDSTDTKTDPIVSFSDLNNTSDTSFRKDEIKTSSTPRHEEKTQKSVNGLLSMVPRSVAVFRKQPEENVQTEPSPTYCRPMPPQFSSPYSQKQQNERKEVESPLLNLVGMGNVAFQRKMKRNHLNERQTNVSTVYTSPKAAAPEPTLIEEHHNDGSKQDDDHADSQQDEPMERGHWLEQDDYEKFRGNVYADMSFQNPTNARNTKPSEHERAKNTKPSEREETRNTKPTEVEGTKEKCKENGIEDEAAKDDQSQSNGIEKQEKMMKEMGEVLPSNVLPSKGWYLSFKMLELSAFGCPEVSDFKLAEVMDVDIASKSVTLQCTSKFAKRSSGSLLTVEGTEPSTDEGLITMSWTDVIEPRQVLV